MTLEATEKECAAVAIAPRVALADIEAAIAARYHLTAAEAIGPASPSHPSLDILSVCFVVMRNGFVVVGKSAPASRENFNAELGRKLAYEDAIRQLWPLMGFALRQRFYETPAL
jgi:Phage protein (N4 Gp49/phage Sf6 gene 66) family